MTTPPRKETEESKETATNDSSPVETPILQGSNESSQAESLSLEGVEIQQKSAQMNNPCVAAPPPLNARDIKVLPYEQHIKRNENVAAESSQAGSSNQDQSKNTAENFEVEAAGSSSQDQSKNSQENNAAAGSSSQGQSESYQQNEPRKKNEPRPPRSNVMARKQLEPSRREQERRKESVCDENEIKLDTTSQSQSASYSVNGNPIQVQPGEPVRADAVSVESSVLTTPPLFNQLVDSIKPEGDCINKVTSNFIAPCTDEADLPSESSDSQSLSTQTDVPRLEPTPASPPPPTPSSNQPRSEIQRQFSVWQFIAHIFSRLKNRFIRPNVVNP